MNIFQSIKDFCTPTHLKLLLAFVVIYIGTVFPQQMTLCALIASYLGVNIVVNGIQAGYRGYCASSKK